MREFKFKENNYDSTEAPNQIFIIKDKGGSRNF